MFQRNRLEHPSKKIILRGCYRPQTKLWEGHIFTCVRLWFCSGGSPCDHYTWCIWTWKPPPIPDMGSNLCYWHLVVITGDLFKLVHLKTYLPRTKIQWWPLEHVWLASGRAAWYWNAVFLHFLLLTTTLSAKIYPICAMTFHAIRRNSEFSSAH